MVVGLSISIVRVVYLQEYLSWPLKRVHDEIARLVPDSSSMSSCVTLQGSTEQPAPGAIKAALQLVRDVQLG